LPPASLPPFADHDVVAEFVVPSHGRLTLPASDAELLVHELVCTPAAQGESFSHGERCLHFAPGSTVTVHARLRVYGTGGQPPRPLSELLRSAHAVRDLRAHDGPPPESP
jgi:hypothetical protein